MIRPEDARIQKMMEVFEALALTSEELEIIERYLRDEAGEESLKGLAFRDMEKLSPEVKGKGCELGNNLLNKKHYGELKKMFKIMFALGQSTCGQAFVTSLMQFRDKNLREQIGMSTVQFVALYARSLGHSMWFCRAHTLDGFYTLAEHNPENLRVALQYCTGGTSTGRLLLYTVYFWKKYGADALAKKTNQPVVQSATQSVTQDATQKGGLFGTLSKLFGNKKETVDVVKPVTPSKVSVLEPRDMEMMKAYEDILVSNLEGLITQPLPPDFLAKLQNEVRRGMLSEELAAQLKDAAVDERMLEKIGGCAYINYMLSDVLKAVVMLCAVANPFKTLDMMSDMDGRGDLAEQGGDYDRIFHVSPAHLIAWAAKGGVAGYNGYGRKITEGAAKKILTKQFQKNRQLFLEAQKLAAFESSNLMMEVIKEADSALYKNMMGSGNGEQKEKVIQVMINRLNCQKECAEYLRGNIQIESLYVIADNIKASNWYYGGANEWKALEAYYKRYNDRDFYNRCMVIMAFAEVGYFFRQPMNVKEADWRNVVLDIFRSLDEGKLDMGRQLHTFVIIYDTLYSDKEKYLTAAMPVFVQYLNERPEETKKAFAEAEAFGRYFGLCVMEKEPDAYQSEILGFSQDGAKVVKEKLEEILKGRPDWRTEVTALLSSKKAAERELAIRVLLHWNTPEDLEALRGLLEKEKNAKVRNLLESTLQSGEGEGSAPVAAKVLTMEELVKNLHKGGKKRSLAWAYETPFSNVHKKSGELAEEENLQAILLCYVAMSTPGVSSDAQLLAADLNEAEFAMYVNELFDKWLEAGAEAKKRWVMYAASIHGGSDIVKKFQHQIQEWPQHARGAIAADAVQALALNPHPQALLLVDSIARKFKFKQVKAAAGKALEFAAAQLGLSREELEDKIVPDLGFDENMERRFDYGERSFTITITPALEIEVFDEDGKKLKNLPAPGKKDDEEKANAAYAEFKEMKKQMKTTISSQKMRLELALSSERLWSIDAWQNLFVKNPVMHQFAIGLIWGIYEEHKLVQSFRYMEDGSFNTEDEDEFTLPQQGYIGLVHPIELTAESVAAWKQQLADYEIIQPIDQLTRPLYRLTEEESGLKSLERFGGMLVNDLSLNGKLQQLGWYRGSVQDAGCFDTFYREDASLGLGVELHFSGTYVACEGEDVTVYDARFYKAGSITRGSYMYDEADDQKCILLEKIPERYFSEIVLQLTKATASSKERDEDWKKDRR